MYVELVEAHRTLRMAAVDRPAPCPTRCRDAMKAATSKREPSRLFMLVWSAVRLAGRRVGEHEGRYRCYSRLWGRRRLYRSYHEVYEVSGDAERAVSLYKLASALNKITDAAGDIAKAFLDFRAHLDFEEPYSNGDEVVARLEVAVDKPTTIEDLLVALDIIVDVVALKREGKWLTEPPLGTVLKKGDVLIVKGVAEAVEAFAEAVKSPLKRAMAAPPEVASKLLDLSKTVDLMYSLALAALLTRARRMADYVLELEQYVDELLLEFERDVLSSGLSEDEKGAALFAAFAVEHVADAALEIAYPVLQGIEPPPIILDVLEETRERISAIEIDAQDAGSTLSDLDYVEKGVLVLAVKRGRRWFVMPPYTGFELEPGDVLIVKYYEESQKFIEGEEAEESRRELIEDAWEEAG